MSFLTTARKGYGNYGYSNNYARIYDKALLYKHNNPWEFADDKDLVSQYMNTDEYQQSSRGKGGISTMDIAGTAAGAVNGLSAAFQDEPQYSADANNGFGFVDNFISQGTKTKGGTALVNTGASVMNLGLKTNNPYLMLAGGIAGTLGTLWNAGLGVKENKQNTGALKANRALARTAGQNLGSVTNTSDYFRAAGKTTSSLGFKASDLYKNGWWTDKGTKLGNIANSKEQGDLAFQNNAGISGAQNVDKINDNMTMGNFKALGGELDGIDPSTAIGYQLYTDKYIRNNNNNVSNMFAGTPNIFALGGGHLFPSGGNIQTHGADLDNGVTHIDTGSTHEQNPHEGVQVGVDQQNVPNLVEEGEVIYKDYVFSNRLDVPKYDKKDDSREAKVLRKYSGKTFADTAKKIEKRMGADERTDTITKTGLEAELQILAQVQEKERQKQRLQEIQEAIDNMTPEEFAMLQQQMQAQQAEQQQQEAAMAQQEAMAQQQQQEAPQEVQQPMPQEAMQAVPQEAAVPTYQNPNYSALGGPLGADNNIYAYGGSFSDFNKELQNRGLSLADYLRYLVNNGDLTQEEADIYMSDKDAVLLESQFNKDLAEKYLSSLNTKEKEVARMYRKKGQDPKKLTGAALKKYQEDVTKASKNPELLEKDSDKQLFINQVGKSKPETFNAAAGAAVVRENRDAFLPERALNDNGKLSIRYNDEGTIPQGLSFLNDGVTYDKDRKAWLNNAGEVIENPYTSDYGFTDVKRDWGSWGYIDKDGNWHSVDAPQPSTSGNTDYRFTPTAEWSKDLGDAKSYEQQEQYLNNYADFIEALNKGDQDALKRLYTLGEATKSNNPEDRKSKNRYFKEGVDPNNLKKEDVIGYDPNHPEYGIFGNKYYTDAFGIEDIYSKDGTYAYNKEGSLIRVDSNRWNNLSNEQKKAYTQIEGPLTREHLMNNLKWAINQYPENWSPTVDDLYLQGVSDNVWGPHHLMSNEGTKRYALVDEQGNYIRDANNNIRYLDYNPDATYRYYNNGNPLEGQSQYINGVNVDTIGILGGTVDNHIGVRRNPDGTWRTYDLTPEQVAKLKQREILKTDKRYDTLPQFEDAVEGYTFNPHYYELDDDAYKSLGFDDQGYKLNGEYTTGDDSFPKAPNWPYLLGAGLQLSSLGYNIFSPKDYSNANAMIKAAKEAGNYIPIDFKPIGNYLEYRPMDVWAGVNRLNANSRATDRAILNSGAVQGSQIAGMLANAYTNQIGSGELFRQSQEYNDNLRKQVAEFNKDTDKFNSEGLLKKDMANQDAATRASGFTLEGLKSGYAMKQAIDDARANAINVGISGLANLAYNYAQNKYNQDLLGWGMKHNSWGPGVYFEEDRPSRTTSTPTYVSSGARGNTVAKGGKLKVRRKKGLGF